MKGLMDRVFSFSRYQSRQQNKPVAEPEVLNASPLPMVGLFALLTEEQKKLALAFDENEGFGPDDFRRKKA